MAGVISWCEILFQILSGTGFWHRLARLLKQQTSITVHCLPTKKNKLPSSVFHLQKTDGSLPFPFSVSSVLHIYICIYIYIYISVSRYIFIYIYIYILPFLTENGRKPR